MSTRDDTCLHLRRVDPALNMARFYIASLEPSLLGHASLLRVWGRIGTQGRSRIDLFDNTTGAEQALSTLRRQKLKRGYIEVRTAAPHAADITDLVHAAPEPDTP